MSTPTSPSDEVTFRPPHAPSPKFAGMTPNLPSAIRQLRRPKSTIQPGEMTVLANRIGGIRLDYSPDDCSSSPYQKSPYQKSPHQVYPLKLEFSEQDDNTEKENIPTDIHNLHTQPVQPANIFSQSPQPAPAYDRSTECQSPSTEDAVPDVQQPRNSALHSHDHDSALSPRFDKIDSALSKALEERITEDSLAITTDPVSSTTDVEQATLEVQTNVNPSNVECRTSLDDHKNDLSPKSGKAAVVEKEACTPKENNQAVAVSIEIADESKNTIDSERLLETGELGQPIQSEPKNEEADALGPFGEEEPPENEPKVLPVGELQRFMGNIDKVMEGKARWKWPDRCDALKSMSTTVENHLNHEVHAILREKMPTLGPKVRDHLGELRPSIISAVLTFFDSIMLSSFSAEAFAREVFPGAMEIASGHSLRACNAAHSLAIALDVYPSLNGLLADVDNPQRLLEVVEEYCEKEDTGEEMRAKAQRIANLVQETLAKPVVSDNSVGPPSLNTILAEETNQQVVQDTDTQTTTEGIEGLPVDENRTNGTDTEVLDDKENEIKSNAERIRSLRFSRMSWRAKLETPSLIGKQGILKDVFESGGSGKGGISNRSRQGRESTSESPWKGRAYTQEEVDEIRHAAIEAVIDKLGQAHNIKREEMERDNISLQQKHEKERAENVELRSVLEEFEMTMSKMVSEGNSQANAQHLALQSDKNSLKAELLEVSEAFEKIKDKYDMSKQTIELMETKESRLIEQSQDLKKSMVELQTWSNDLKANTEKKLNKAFESVTFFRSSCLEQEAHAAKAMSDLEKMKVELEKASVSHRETAAKLVQCEGDFHLSQDARTELNGQLSTAKTSVQRLTTHRDSLQTDVERARKEMNELKARVGELESLSVRLADSQKQLDTMRSERQELKARAFDDMTRVRNLERQLASKEKELDELGIICEDAMSELENRKLGNHS